MDLDPLRKRLEQLRPLLEFLDEEKRQLYLVGGCVRDTVLGRDIADLDFVTEGSGIEYARLLASRMGGTFVPLKFEEGRVVLEKQWILDFQGLGAGGIEANLQRRDFTINAVAVEVSDLLNRRWRMFDPTGGLADLERRTIRMTSSRSLTEDPLRILRAFRLSSQLGFRIDPETLKAIGQHSRSLESVAAERVTNELMLLLKTDDSSRSIREMSDAGVLTRIFPELREMDQLLPEIRLLDHSIACLRELEGILGRRSVLAELEPELEDYLGSTKKVPLLKLATLLHDIGKPRTLSSCESGRVHFYGHDSVGEELLQKLLKERLRMSRRDVNTVTSLVRHHMRPHLLAGEKELTSRALRRFLRDLGEEWIGVLLLALVDALATGNGDTVNLQNFISRLMEFKAGEEKKRSFERLVTGDDLIEELKLRPGPLFAEVLHEVEEEQAEGRISTRGEALDFIREMLKRRGERTGAGS